jgi:hypothetical protein
MLILLVLLLGGQTAQVEKFLAGTFGGKQKTAADEVQHCRITRFALLATDKVI